jgi:Zn-dependent peptidase ImmA (M78 family)/transcriptional regulator with XRE-family HTH domain
MSKNWHLVAYQFNPESLRIARELRGLQKTDLAAELSVTPSAVTQFENGSAKPTPQTVGRMTMALGFPAQFFCAPQKSIHADNCHFRDLRSSAQIERKQMVAVSGIISNVIDYMENEISLPDEQVTPNVVNRPVDLDEIENITTSVRKAWGLGLGPIDNLIGLLESKGIFVFRLLSNCERVDAFSLFLGRRPVIFLNTQKGSTSRTRFDAAHELGHLIMHTDCKPGSPDQEREADHFASCFLMPRETFFVECPHRLVWPHFRALKQRWKVSLAALVRRARDIGKLSDHTYKRAYIQMNQFGWRKHEPDEPPIEYPKLFPKALSLLADDNIALSEIAENVNVNASDLHNWIYADNTVTAPFLILREGDKDDD